jgi:hypothetical protein
LGGETITPYLARLLEISVNNATISSDWKTTMVIPIYKGDDRSAVTNYRPISKNLCGLDITGTRYSRVFVGSLGKE